MWWQRLDRGSLLPGWLQLSSTWGLLFPVRSIGLLGHMYPCITSSRGGVHAKTSQESSDGAWPADRQAAAAHRALWRCGGGYPDSSRIWLPVGSAAEWAVAGRGDPSAHAAGLAIHHSGRGIGGPGPAQPGRKAQVTQETPRAPRAWWWFATRPGESWRPVCLSRFEDSSRDNGRGRVSKRE